MVEGAATKGLLRSREGLEETILDDLSMKLFGGAGHLEGMQFMKSPVIFVVLAVVALAARAADLTGTWKAEFETQIGVQKYVFEFKADGEKLTGKAIGERETDKSEVAIAEGKIVGDEVSFVENLKFGASTCGSRKT